jgi:Spy/CpxP family protein refolding chaperone
MLRPGTGDHIEEAVMFRFRSLAAGTAVAALLATSVAFAQGPRGGGPFGRGGPVPFGLELRALNLTDGQREQVREIQQRHREQGRTASQRLNEAAEKQRQAIETLPVDETLITSATQDMTQAQVDVAIQQARLNADVWSVLTPEQQAQATKLRAERKARLEQRRQELRQRRQNQ